MDAAELIYKNRYGKTMRNIDLQNLLKQYPDDVMVCVEYCNIGELKYYEDKNLIVIE